MNQWINESVKQWVNEAVSYKNQWVNWFNDSTNSIASIDSIHSVSQWISKSMNQWINGSVNKRLNEWIDGRVDGRVDGLMSELLLWSITSPLSDLFAEVPLVSATSSMSSLLFGPLLLWGASQLPASATKFFSPRSCCNAFSNLQLHLHIATPSHRTHSLANAFVTTGHKPA